MRFREFQTQGAGCLLVAQDTGRWCLQQRSDSVSDPGVWSTWGGGPEPGESLEQTVRRELAEEAGYHGPLTLYPLSENRQYVTFVGVVPQEFEPRPCSEWKDYCWVDQGQWPQPLHHKLMPALEKLITSQVVEVVAEDTDNRSLPSVNAAKQVMPRILAAAQRVYNDWDENDRDTYAGGGICHIIADAICDVLGELGIDSSPVSCSYEQHVYVAGRFAEGIYTIDIPYHIYETGGGFSWKKIPAVTFEPGDVVFYRVSGDPEDFEQYISESVSSFDPQDLTQDVAEGSEQKYLWHGSRQPIQMLEPRQSIDTGGAAGSNQNAIYATSDPKVAIAVGGLTTPDSDTAMFPNDPQMVLFKGKIRKGENVYLHKLPYYGPDGKPQFVKGANDREFYSIPSVRGIEPVEIKAVPVDKYLNLIRQATPHDLELQKQFSQKQDVAENFADGRNPGRRGLAKRVGVNCKQSVTKLRSIAKKSSGERQRMAHWCANMKSGKNK